MGFASAVCCMYRRKDCTNTIQPLPLLLVRNLNDMYHGSCFPCQFAGPIRCIRLCAAGELAYASVLRAALPSNMHIYIYNFASKAPQSQAYLSCYEYCCPSKAKLHQGQLYCLAFFLRPRCICCGVDFASSFCLRGLRVLLGCAALLGCCVVLVLMLICWLGYVGDVSDVCHGRL